MRGKGGNEGGISGAGSAEEREGWRRGVSSVGSVGRVVGEQGKIGGKKFIKKFSN